MAGFLEDNEFIKKYGKYVAVAVALVVVAVILIVYGKQKGDNRLTWAGYGCLAGAGAVGAVGYFWSKPKDVVDPGTDKGTTRSRYGALITEGSASE